MNPTKTPAAIVSGSQAMSIEGLVREHYAYIKRLALSILDDAQEAEDAAQETFISADRALPSFRQTAQAKTWLSAIAVNVCRGRLRKRKVRLALHNTLTALHIQNSSAISIEAEAVSREADRLLWSAVDHLDEKHRLPVVLRYVHEMSAAEIAAVLGINEGTVHSRLHYARFALQARLGQLNSREEVSDDTSNPR